MASLLVTTEEGKRFRYEIEAGSVRTFQDQPHLLIVPSFFVVALLFAFALLGDGLNDAVRGR